MEIAGKSASVHLDNGFGKRFALMDRFGTIEQQGSFIARQYASGAGLFNSRANQFKAGPGVLDRLWHFHCILAEMVGPTAAAE